MLRVEKEIHNRQPPATNERAGWDRFGFLPAAARCQFQGGEIEPVANYEDVQQWVQEHLYQENLLAQRGGSFEPGILFPPAAWRQLHDPVTDELLGVVQGSEGPPLLHRVPTSHYLRLDGVTDLMTAREGAAGFVTKVVGFLYDAPTQFHHWWFDGPTSIATKSLDPAPIVLEDFASHAYAGWQRWAPEPQQLVISALKMHGRAPGHRSSVALGKVRLGVHGHGCLLQHCGRSLAWALSCKRKAQWEETKAWGENWADVSPVRPQVWDRGKRLGQLRRLLAERTHT